MSHRTANYSAFYVAEPYSDSALGAYATRDFVYYNELRAWKAKDNFFPFVDAHAKTYNVRDGSQWETLRSRLHERLNLSKNIILFLSSYTRNSRALSEEIDYGINIKGLPVIVVYPEFDSKYDIYCQNGIRKQVKDLWDKLPIFRDSMLKVATIHVPLKKELIYAALSNREFQVQYMTTPDIYYYE